MRVPEPTACCPSGAHRRPLLCTGPIAPLRAITLPAGQVTEVALAGLDWDGDHLVTRLLSWNLTAGYLSQLSQVYGVHGYEPMAGELLEQDGSGVKVLDEKARFAVTMVDGREPREMPWGSILYTVEDSTAVSEPGMAWLLSSSRVLVASRFDEGVDGWSIVRNGQRAGVQASGGLKHMPYTLDNMAGYVLGEEGQVHTHGSEKHDGHLWAFHSPPKFQGNFALAYGGHLRFTIALPAGSRAPHAMNTGVPAVLIECDSCGNGQGTRMGVFMDTIGYMFDKGVLQVALPLDEANWKQDPRSSIEEWFQPSQCDFVEALAHMSRILITGDLTQSHEVTALDNVEVTAGGDAPLACQARWLSALPMH